MPMLVALSLMPGLATMQVEAEEKLTPISPEQFIAIEDDDRIWIDALTIGAEGQGFTDLAGPYDRLPAEAEGVVRGPVWGLSRNSAGIAIRFWTDSSAISAKWTLHSSNLAMNHMAATGVSGLDLYGRGEDAWHWIGVGRPGGVENEARLVGGLAPGLREYLLYLPLYNGVSEVRIGFEPGSQVLQSAGPVKRPVVFYGTSITQGGCASRTGMAYPAIIGRWLDVPTINLGFSGNGQMEPEVVELISQIDASVFVLDTLPNMNPEMVTERAGAAVKALRAAHPDTPIIMVENITYQSAPLVASAAEGGAAKNRALREVYKGLIEDGIEGLTYVEGPQLLGDDGEGTVDGTHPTDLGFLRMAEALTPVVKGVLSGAPHGR